MTTETTQTKVSEQLTTPVRVQVEGMSVLSLQPCRHVVFQASVKRSALHWDFECLPFERSAFPVDPKLSSIVAKLRAISSREELHFYRAAHIVSQGLRLVLREPKVSALCIAAETFVCPLAMFGRWMEVSGAWKLRTMQISI
jgi:hypothetical protein